jgi:hypothetical protein
VNAQPGETFNRTYPLFAFEMGQGIAEHFRMPMKRAEVRADPWHIRS